MNIPDSFEVAGLRCFEDPDDRSLFYYVPSTPGPEVDQQNRPTLLMFVSNTGAMLQLGSTWRATTAQLETLRSELLKRHADLEPGDIRLSTGASSVRKVTLELGDGAGAFETLQSSSSSGFPPYSAIFNVKLTAGQKDRAAAALNGRSGFLKIAYQVSVPAIVSVDVSISGDVQDELSKLDSAATVEGCQERIEAALADGRLTLEVVAHGPVPEELRQKARRLATEKAAGTLLTMTRPSAAGKAEARIDIKVSLAGTVVAPEERSTDISTWFPGGAGPDHVLPLPGGGAGGTAPVAGPTGTEDPVLLSFEDRAELPVAFIEIARGGKKALLRPPAFEAVKLERTVATEPATITTSYTSGGPPFKAAMAQPGADGWILAPEQLGLQRVYVDATARRDAGAREVRIRIRYRPSGLGSEDDRTIYLRKDTWTLAFFEVTRSASLDGILEFEWKETAADGSVKNGKLQGSDSSLSLT